MKAVVLTQQGSSILKLTDRSIPKRTAPNQVLVRVLAVGLDGTDKELIHSRKFEPVGSSGELILGHELLGEVAESNPSSRFQKGDLVTAMVRRPCNHSRCMYCRSGQNDYCETWEFTERGIKGADGFLCEWIVEDEAFLLPVPKKLGLNGILIEPQSIVEKALAAIKHNRYRLEWQPKRALVLGAGPLGTLAALTCRVLGWETTIWSKESAEAYAPMLLQNIGCTYLQITDLSLEMYLKQFDRTMDIILECTGYSPLAFESTRVLDSNGILALMGVSIPTGDVPVPTDVWMRRIVLDNLTVFGSVNASITDTYRAIERLESIEQLFPNFLSKIITDKIELDQVVDLNFSDISLKAAVILEKFS